MANKLRRMCVCYGGMKKNKNLFISRELSPDSIFLQLLTNRGYEVSGQSLIAFEQAGFTAYPSTDWIFFYSARAAAYFSSGLESLGLPWPAQTKIAAMGTGTARWLQLNQRQVDFIGNGRPRTVASNFSALAKQQSVLFPRAKNSKQSIQRLLDLHIEALDLIVYHNEPQSDFSISPANILVFTSPMNAKTYIQKYPITKDQAIISIGTSTTQALSELGYPLAIEAKEASEKGLAEAVLGLGKTKPD